MSKSIFQSLGNEAFKGNCNPRVCLWVHYFDGDLPVHPQINLAEENLAKQRRPDSTKPPTLVGAVLDPEQAPSTSRHHGMSPPQHILKWRLGPEEALRHCIHKKHRSTSTKALHLGAKLGKSPSGLAECMQKNCSPHVVFVPDKYKV